MPKTHRLDAGPETVHWGYFDAALRPLLRIESGDGLVDNSIAARFEQVKAILDGYLEHS